MAATVTESQGWPDQGKLYKPLPCRIDAIAELTPSEKLFRVVRLDQRPFTHRPGQFMQVSIWGIGEAPISVSSSPTRGPYLELGVRRAGTLTTALHACKVGDTLGLRGPFGTFFDTESMAGKDLLLISGGCGLAPMRALIQWVEDRRHDFGEVTILYGAKSPQDVLYQEELALWKQSRHMTCKVTVDRVTSGTCWDGQLGLLTTLMPDLQIHPRRTVAVIVGPPVMYRHVIKALYDHAVPQENIVVSLERYMKCGVGKCGHCTIDHIYCCMDGPVFRLDQVAGLQGAL
jgi:NAD(P)H-flavin reductase